jgi:hypothetical protein
MFEEKQERCSSAQPKGQVDNEGCSRRCEFEAMSSKNVRFLLATASCIISPEPEASPSGAGAPRRLGLV